MEIWIKSIPQDKQRYETAGDYWFNEPDLTNIRVSETGNDDYSFLIVLHELIESYLIKKRGISEPEIMAFDIAHADSDDPGSEPDAPYRKEHFFSEAIERLVAGE